MFTAVAATVLTCLSPTAVDGDTLRCANVTSNIRLWGIQAPERGAAGWAESRASLQTLAEGGVVCEVKGTSYERVVGQCYNTRLFDLGFFQLQERHATEWCRFSQGFYGTCR